MAIHKPRTENQPVLSGGKGGNWRTVLPVYTGSADGGSPCACCGWVGPNNRPAKRADTEQEAVLCPLCVLPTVLPHTLTAGKGRLAIVPELTQTEINNLYRWGFLGLYAKQCLADGTSWLTAEDNRAYADKAREMAPLSALLRELDSLFAQRGETALRSHFHAGNVPSAMFFPVALSQIKEERYREREQHFAPLRVVPDYSVLDKARWGAEFRAVDFDNERYRSAYPGKITAK